LIAFTSTFRLLIPFVHGGLIWQAQPLGIISKRRCWLPEPYKPPTKAFETRCLSLIGSRRVAGSWILICILDAVSWLF
jgi:hypothetical protein